MSVKPLVKARHTESVTNLSKLVSQLVVGNGGSGLARFGTRFTGNGCRGRESCGENWA